MFLSPVIKQNTPTNVCLTRTKQISSELVCRNSFVKIICTYFFVNVSHAGMWYKVCFCHVSAPVSALH